MRRAVQLVMIKAVIAFKPVINGDLAALILQHQLLANNFYLKIRSHGCEEAVFAAVKDD